MKADEIIPTAAELAEQWAVGDHDGVIKALGNLGTGQAYDLMVVTVHMYTMLSPPDQRSFRQRIRARYA